ncbi:MAG: DNA repair protein RadC [Elusimicrobiota bacterium]
MTQPTHKGHRQRLSGRFTHSRLTGFADHEILEFILTFARPRVDTKPAAKELLKKFKSLSGVFDAQANDLILTPGIGERCALLLSLFKPVCLAYLNEGLRAKSLLDNPQAVVRYCRLDMAANGHETVRVLYVDSRNYLICEKTVSLGSIDRAPVYPRRIIEEALLCHGAGFILAHNHPSGDVTPSREDRELTDRLGKIAKDMELSFLDHLIVSHKGYYSFKEHGLLK